MTHETKNCLGSMGKTQVNKLTQYKNMILEEKFIKRD